MKKLALILSAVVALAALGHVGPERNGGNGKAAVQAALPLYLCNFYDWDDVDIWATYFSPQGAAQDSDFDLDDPDEALEIAQRPVFLGDHLLRRDDARRESSHAKEPAVTVGAVTAVIPSVHAPRKAYSDREVIQPIVLPIEWYRAHEWNIDIWAAYAFSAQSGQRNLDLTLDELNAIDEQFDRTERPVFLGEPIRDRFLSRDNAWGAGGDLKYFWSRYFGAGLEGFVLNARNTGGAALATFTVRYPIRHSRFAPYAFGGVGGLFGGSHAERYFAEHHVAYGVEDGEVEFFYRQTVDNKHPRVIGQFGSGLEVRLTRPSTMSKIAVGLMADFTWNFIGGEDSDDQDFGMTRFGLNFSY